MSSLRQFLYEGLELISSDLRINTKLLDLMSRKDHSSSSLILWLDISPKAKLTSLKLQSGCSNT